MNKLIIEKLFNLQCFKFGLYKLKTNLESPFYINLRHLIAYPEIMKTLARIIYLELIEKHHLKCMEEGHILSICGLPYAGMPIANYISNMYNIPLLLLRKERKNYGTKQMIEGITEKTEKVILIDDIITSGSSILESIQHFENMEILDILVIIDREQKKQDNLNYNFLFKISDIFHFLKTQKLISKDDYDKSIHFIKNN